jgi:hypothetical protein
MLPTGASQGDCCQLTMDQVNVAQVFEFERVHRELGEAHGGHGGSLGRGLSSGGCRAAKCRDSMTQPADDREATVPCSVATLGVGGDPERPENDLRCRWCLA